MWWEQGRPFPSQCHLQELGMEETEALDTLTTVQTPDRLTSIVEVVGGLQEEERRKREAIWLAEHADPAGSSGHLLVEPHALPPHCPADANGATPGHAHHLVIFSMESVYFGEEAKTVTRFSAFCRKCDGEDTWGVVEPNWAKQNPHAMESLEALSDGLNRMRERPPAPFDEEDGYE